MSKPKIKPTDIISGATYLKFLESYKRYDCQQKQYIEKLLGKIELLQWELEHARLEIEEMTDDPDWKSRRIKRLEAKMKNQRENLRQNERLIIRLKADNERLRETIVTLLRGEKPAD